MTERLTHKAATDGQADAQEGGLRDLGLGSGADYVVERQFASRRRRHCWRGAEQTACHSDSFFPLPGSRSSQKRLLASAAAAAFTPQ